MSHRTVLQFAVLGFLSVFSLLMFGQENAQSNPTTQSRTVTHPLLVNLTGCLKKSSTSGGYYIADQNGRTWELSSKNVDLGKQVFHTVSVSGHPSNGSRVQEGKSEQDQQPEGNRNLSLEVTELEMVSPSCTR